MPSWRIDDVMISFAVDGGSVGPHTDEYDVFLIQTQGQRRWQINADPEADRSLLPDLDMKILQQFDAEQAWLAEPGDVLYLPPGVAHYGVAVGDCITWSVGFRAPSAGELLPLWIEERLQMLPDTRYSDPDLQLSEQSGEITEEAISSLKRILFDALHQETGDFANWFGRYITEPKENLLPEPVMEITETEQLLEKLGSHTLTRHPASKILYTLVEERLQLFSGGMDFELPVAALPFARLMSRQESWNLHELERWLSDNATLPVLLKLVESGYLFFEAS
jgi:50S ribosomal protein L16 3-hydroxylase